MTDCFLGTWTLIRLVYDSTALMYSCHNILSSIVFESHVEDESGGRVGGG